ncbi:hypothetical protein KSD_40190 [Ktedonobacter sp. SOSP1-85]|nr:hypothetical protein KSD_40190 [Ktedonobacter sp. SOSP1-85]
MNYWQKLTRKPEQQVDDHDMPTEPVPYPEAVPEPGYYGQGYQEPGVDPGLYDDRTIATPPPPASHAPHARGRRQIVPPPPHMQWQPPAYPGYAPQPQPDRYAHPQPAYTPPARRRGPEGWRLLPGFLAIFLVIVQLSLFARFVMRFLLHIPADQSWVAALYTFSTVFLIPVQLLGAQVHLPFTVDPELYALPAIIIYGVLSRILVKLLRFIVRAF